uniref:Uncharacterized protein n=1 Tax=Nelumbo nucifera TaxID=4432 RepID=A0A822Z0S2_NELNU|nr:TPA_asm: hypothetical protein HUJ06_007730 [Nelumbo nucifera]
MNKHPDKFNESGRKGLRRTKHYRSMRGGWEEYSGQCSSDLLVGLPGSMLCLGLGIGFFHLCLVCNHIYC